MKKEFGKVSERGRLATLRGATQGSSRAVRRLWGQDWARGWIVVSTERKG